MPFIKQTIKITKFELETISYLMPRCLLFVGVHFLLRIKVHDSSFPHICNLTLLSVVMLRK